LVAHSAAIYARISSDPDGTQLGVTRQVTDCLALAEKRGWRVVETYVDDDVSAYRGKPRAAYTRMLTDIRSGIRDGVVVWHLDRLHRHPRELEDFLDACEQHGVTDLATVSGDIDLGTHDGQLHARILGAVARKESDDKSRRLRRKHLELAQAGKVGGGGTRPFGFDSDRKTIRAGEAEVIREAAARVLAGDSLRSVCTDFALRGIRTPKSNVWGQHTLRHLLISPRISGQREHHGEIVAPAEWPAIVSPAIGARLRAHLNDPARRTNRSPRRYLLASLLRCAACHTVMRARPRADGKRRYVCAKGPSLSGCGKTFILAEDLEHFVIAAVLHRLDSPRLAMAVTLCNSTDQHIVDAERKLDEAQAQLEQLATNWGKQEISKSEWQAARAPILERVATARATLTTMSQTAAVAEYLGNAEALRSAWDTLTLSRQRAIVSAVLEYVEIGFAVRGRNRFDPERVTPRWRAV
jgi:site-specific DNA recombinase